MQADISTAPPTLGLLAAPQGDAGISHRLRSGGRGDQQKVSELPSIHTIDLQVVTTAFMGFAANDPIRWCRLRTIPDVSSDAEDSDRYRVRVTSNGESARWVLQVTEGEYPELTVTLTAPTRTWTATGFDVFEALMNLREQLDTEGIRLCCNGARRNAWASGMQRDMGQGRFVYVLDDEQSGRHQVETLADAPCEDVGTVHEQREYYAGWLARLTNLPGNGTA